MPTKSKKQKRPAVEDGDSMTFFCGTYTFRKDAKLPNDIQIARTPAQTVKNINKAVNMRIAKYMPRRGIVLDAEAIAEQFARRTMRASTAT